MSAKQTKKKGPTKKETGDARAHRKAAGEINRAAAKAAKPKPVTQRDVLDAPVPESCPKGGEHEWTDDECSKCHEPKPQADAATATTNEDRAGAKTKSVAKGASAKDKASKTKGDATPKKLSAIDAAAKVLAEAGQPMTTRQMIEAMAAKGYWSSPNGQTPAATLYSAILRQIKTKGKGCRFLKTDRGHFALAERG